MAIRILLMGLSGSGKTVLAEKMVNRIQASGKTISWFNADKIRKACNDWDFSEEGRLRQSSRMRELSDSAQTEYAICDFIAPLPQMREIFQADWMVWLDTVDHSVFEDTNSLFVSPERYDFRITEKDAERWSKFIVEHILNNKRRPEFDWRKETVQLLGRWQPWHAGHRALFERALAKTGQVCIMIRDCQGWKESNPFSIEEVKNHIHKDLSPMYQGMYEIMVVPNIVNITYGREVGYTIEQEFFEASIERISGTRIRAEMGLP